MFSQNKSWATQAYENVCAQQRGPSTCKRVVVSPKGGPVRSSIVKQECQGTEKEKGGHITPKNKVAHKKILVKMGVLLGVPSHLKGCRNTGWHMRGSLGSVRNNGDGRIEQTCHEGFLSKPKTVCTVQAQRVHRFVFHVYVSS